MQNNPKYDQSKRRPFLSKIRNDEINANTDMARLDACQIPDTILPPAFLKALLQASLHFSRWEIVSLVRGWVGPFARNFEFAIASSQKRLCEIPLSTSINRQE